MLHCWNLWLCEANYRDVERLEGIPPRPHVLTYQAPATSLTEDGPVVLPPHGRTISCACELAVQIDHEVHLADETTAAEAIRGYRVLAGFRDSSLIEEVPLPSDRDEGTGDRCGRWSDGFNCVSALIPPGEVGDPYDARMSVTIDGFEPVITHTGDYLHRAPAAIVTLSQFLTLQPGDIISLGRAGQMVTVPAGRRLSDRTRVIAEINGVGKVESLIEDLRAGAD